MNNSENQQFDFLDILEVVAFIVQVLDYEATLSQVGNNEILKELRTDMTELRQQNDVILRELGKNRLSEKL